MGNPNDIDASWLTFDGKVINPGAPAGGGGAGSFRIAAGPVGVDNPVFPALPSPDSPVGLYDDPAIPLDANTPPAPVQKKNSPPLISIGDEPWASQSDALYDVEVKLFVPAFDFDPNFPTGGETAINGDRIEEPTYPTYDTKGGPKIVEFTTKFVLHGAVTIQVTYQKESSKYETSDYGRGTTDDDKRNGDITLGFHESCHVADFKEFAKNNPLPIPSFKVGMTVVAYNAEIAKFRAKFPKKWIDDATAFSLKKTDETGKPTLSQYKKDNP